MADTFDQQIELHWPRILAYVRLHAGPLLRRRESCADLAQSVFREFLEARAPESPPLAEVELRKLLFTMARAKLVDRTRYHMAAKRDPSREVDIQDLNPGATETLARTYGTLATPSSDVMARETVDRIERAFDRLPREYAEVITLTRLGGLTYKEAGSTLGKSEDGTRMLCMRALSRLARLLAQPTDGNDT